MEQPSTKSHTVATLFAQLSLHAGSLRVECQHTYNPTHTLTTWENIIHSHTHSNPWGIVNPSPRVSVCRSGRQHGGQGSHQRLIRKDLQIQADSRAEPPAADAKGDQRGVGQPAGVWSSAVSAVVWSLPQLHLGSGVLHPSGSPDRCLGSPAGKWGLCSGAHLWVGPLCRRGCSDTWADMSPCRRVCSDLGSLPLEPKCHGRLAAVLVGTSDSILFYILYAVLIGPTPLYWSCFPQWSLCLSLSRAVWSSHLSQVAWSDSICGESEQKSAGSNTQGSKLSPWRIQGRGRDGETGKGECPVEALVLARQGRSPGQDDGSGEGAQNGGLVWLWGVRVT